MTLSGFSDVHSVADFVSFVVQNLAALYDYKTIEAPSILWGLTGAFLALSVLSFFFARKCKNGLGKIALAFAFVLLLDNALAAYLTIGR